MDRAMEDCNSTNSRERMPGDFGLRQAAAEKEKADGRFKEALDYLEEAAKISPENENVKKMLPQVKAVMK